MQQDRQSRRRQFLKQFREWAPYFLLIGLMVCVAVIILALLGSTTGRVFSNIYSGETWCTWSATAKSWLDENGDGKWDANEPPLPGVQFSIGRDDPVSDFKGEGHGALVTVSVCDSAYQVPVSAVPPSGYRPTTSTIITSSGGGGGHGPFLFGFTYLPGVPTATPRPQLKCNTYASDYDPTSIAIAPDGKVWVGTRRRGVVHYDPADDTWVTDMVVPVTSLAVSNNNEVWVVGSFGAAKFDGANWISYSPKDEVYNVAIMPDGTVWFGTWKYGASRFDPATGTWTTYTEQNGLADNWVATIVSTQDGSVWLGHSPVGSSRSLSRLLPAVQTNGVPVWKIYENYKDMPPIRWISEIAVAADDTLWIAGSDGLGRLDPLTGTWQYYKQGYLMSVAIAPDGSVWATTEDDGARHIIPDKDDKTKGTWEIYRVEDGLADNRISDVAVAQDGSVWFATAKGVSHCAYASRQ